MSQHHLPRGIVRRARLVLSTISCITLGIFGFTLTNWSTQAFGSSPNPSVNSLSTLTIPQPAIPAAQVPVLYTALNKVTCSSSGDCLAMGETQWSGSAPLQPVALEELNGLWSTVNPPWPPDGDTNLILKGISTPSCSSPGNCVDAIDLSDVANPGSPIAEAGILLESSGEWSSLELPSQYAAGVTSLACPSEGTCYFTVEGLANLVELNGTNLSTASVSLPSGTSIASVGSLSCSTFGSCIAIGKISEGVTTEPATFVEQGGIWSAAIIPQPAGAGVYFNPQLGACGPTGECVVVSDGYAGDGGADVGVVSSGSASGSGWTSSLAPSSVPRGSLSNGVIFNWLQCPTFGQCVAGVVVDYSLGGAGGQLQGENYMLDDSFGTWSLPSSSDPYAPNQGNGGSWPPVSCSSVVYCASVAEPVSPANVIVGGTQGWDYRSLFSESSPAAIACVDGGTCVSVDLSAEDEPQVYEQTTSGGAWSLAPIPNPYVQGSPDASISSISCSSATSCAAVGTTVTPGLSSLVLYSMVNGVWSATLAPLPAGAEPYSPTVDCAPDRIKGSTAGAAASFRYWPTTMQEDSVGQDGRDR